MKEKINLNRTQIKYIAIAAMILDHVAAFLLPPDKQPEWIVLYIIMRTIGRIAAPVMFYFLVEGFVHTSSRKKYALRLLCFGILSQIPYSLARYGRISSENINVIITLFLSFLMLVVADKVQNQVAKSAVVFIFILLTAFSDWGVIGPLMVWLFYIFRKDRKKQILSYLFIIAIQLVGTIAFLIGDRPDWYEGICQTGLFLVIPLMHMYNGEPGERNTINKWVFYVFYPIHFCLFLFNT